MNYNYIWTTAAGQKIHIDDMTESHAKNVLKQIFRNMQRLNNVDTLAQNFIKKRAGFIEVNDDTPSNLTHEVCFAGDFYEKKKEVIEVDGKEYILAVDEEDCDYDVFSSSGMWEIDDWGSK
tara:strand:- start:488 stop:850 length:363 start_codon:yes stop_codon:yes gene_type:complete